MNKFENISIKDIANKQHNRIKPEENIDTDYMLYSFSAHDDDKNPIKVKSKEIGSQKYEVPDNCILVTKLNPRIKRVWKVENSQKNSICSTEFVVLKPYDKELLDYLYAVVSSNIFFSDMEKLTGGTSGSHQRVKQSDILNYTFNAPEKYKNKIEIGSLINNINTKIKQNLEISELLKETSQAIYKSWFEFYEPYENYKKINDNTDIPNEFQNIKIKDICNTIGGGTPNTNKDEYWDGNIEWLTPTEVTKSKYPIVSETKRTLSEKGLDNTSAKVVNKHSPLLTSRATVGEVVLNKVKMATNQGFIAIEPEKDYTRYFLFENIKNRKDEIQRLATGSTYDEISQTQFKNLDVNLPPYMKRKKFELISKNIYMKIEKIMEENNNLKELRDYLLPLLLSGEIQINNSD